MTIDKTVEMKFDLTSVDCERATANCKHISILCQ